MCAIIAIVPIEAITAAIGIVAIAADIIPVAAIVTLRTVIAATILARTTGGAGAA